MKKEKHNQKEVNRNSLLFAFFLAGLCATSHQKEDYVVGWWNFLFLENFLVVEIFRPNLSCWEFCQCHMPCHFHVSPPLKVGALLFCFCTKGCSFWSKVSPSNFQEQTILPTMVYEYAVCCYSTNLCIKKDLRSSMQKLMVKITRLEESCSCFFTESNFQY